MVTAKPACGQGLGGGKPGRPGADDGHAWPAGARLQGHDRLSFLVHDEALDMADGQRLVEVRADAGVLAEVIADLAQDRRQRVVLAG